MRRWAPAWSEALKARVARYALERSLGPFLEERLRLEQLSLDLRGGTGTLRHLRLCAAAVDEVLAGLGAPLELREGCVAAVTVTVPWAALGSQACVLRLTGLRLALGPRKILHSLLSDPAFLEHLKLLAKGAKCFNEKHQDKAAA